MTALVVVTAVVTVAALAVAARLLGLITLLFASFVLACCLEPAVNGLSRRGLRRGAAAAVVLFGSLLLLGATLVGVGAAVTGQIAGLEENLPGIARAAADVVTAAGVPVDDDQVAERVADLSRTAATAAQDRAGATVAAVGQVAFNVATGLLVMFYLLADGPKLRRTVCSFLPPARQQAVLRGWEVAVDRAGRYLMSRVVLAAASAVVSWVTFRVLGVPYAEALAVWVGVMSQAIPVVGTYLAAALPILVALPESVVTAAWVALALVAYQQVENFGLAPWVTRRALRLHPAVSLVSVIAGGAVLGVAGVLIALPVLATAQAVISTYLHRHELVDSHLLEHPARS